MGAGSLCARKPRPEGTLEALNHRQRRVATWGVISGYPLSWVARTKIRARYPVHMVSLWHRRAIYGQLSRKGDTCGTISVLDAARGGNMRAAEIVLTRIWPQRRGRPIQLKLPPIKRGRDLVTAQAAVLKAIADGSITPDEGSAVATVLDAHRRATELAELVERVGSLETKFDKVRDESTASTHRGTRRAP